jgi:hypothetical protein
MTDIDWRHFVAYAVFRCRLRVGGSETGPDRAVTALGVAGVAAF